MNQNKDRNEKGKFTTDKKKDVMKRVTEDEKYFLETLRDKEFNITENHKCKNLEIINTIYYEISGDKMQVGYDEISGAWISHDELSKNSFLIVHCPYCGKKLDKKFK